MAEGLARLFRNNIWKLHRLLESVISDRGLQFAAELTKELNRMLGIKTKLLMAFHPQTDRQTEWKFKQYLKFFMEYRQRDWPEWLATVEFTVNNKVHSTTKVLPFIANYRRELRIEADIKRKGKVKKAIEFSERMRRM